MSKLLFGIVLGLGLVGCSSSTTCTNSVRVACDLDGGASCASHQSCILAPLAIDPCPADAGACCFQVCGKDADCPSNESCTGGACVEGRCAATTP